MPFNAFSDPNLLNANLGVNPTPIDTSNLNANAPITNNTGLAFNTPALVDTGNVFGTASASSSNGAPTPTKKMMSQIKAMMLRPALTSHFQCWFNPPENVKKWSKEKQAAGYGAEYNNQSGEIFSLLCTEAALPGATMNTHDINDDYTGVTEKIAYRRMYDDRADFTFYVNHHDYSDLSLPDYSIIMFFESWLSYISNEQIATGLENKNFNYRFRFPDGNSDGKGGYRTTVYINKFERDYSGSYLQYRLIDAYPLAINSMPVSYDSSQILKCTVSFTFTRYIAKLGSYTQVPTTAPNYSDVFTTNPGSGGNAPTTINDNLAIWALSNQQMINNQNRAPVNIASQNQILANAQAAYPPGSPQRAALLQRARSYNPNVNF